MNLVHPRLLIFGALLSFIRFFIMIQSMIATGIMVKKVACHPKFWTIVPPIAIPTTDPAANIELKTPIPIAILDIRGSVSDDSECDGEH